MQDQKIKPITMPGVHSRFLKYFLNQEQPSGQHVLDLGAGEGALSEKLFTLGFQVTACDLFPEHFKVDQVECHRVDLLEPFGFPDNHFDLVVSVEVSEHILDHENFFSEVNRILKPGGRLYLSTPNILSMKSRIRFLYRGFPFAFNPLEMENYNGRQHVASLTLDQYNYLAVKHHFGKAEFEVDRFQKSSVWLFVLLYPFLFLNQLARGFSPLHNRKKLLLGRLLFMRFTKRGA